MRFERLTDAQAVAERAADLVAETLGAKPDSVLLLPAGATPIPLYAELVRRARRGTIDLARAHLFQLDELVGVARDDARSFRAFFERHLLEPLGLARRFHALDGAARRPEQEIERHRRELEDRGGPDLALVGLGQNGHVAFNEPGSPLAARARVVELGAATKSGLAHHFPGTGCPRQGLTLGLAEIAASARIALLVTGEAKAEILSAVLQRGPTSELPATQLLAHQGLLLLADHAAARA